MIWGPFGLNGKRAVVTGAAMGIGRGIAKRLLEAGADVLLVDRDERAVFSAAEQLSDPHHRVVAMTADLAEALAGKRIVARCVEALGGLDILVNNAGIYPMVPMLEMSSEQFDEVYKVNLRGLALLSQAAGLQLVKQGTGGKIINIASVDSFHPSMVGLAAYDASKGGVLMFTKSFALEMAPHGVTVNGIAPGGVTTEGTSRPLAASGMTAEQQKAMMERMVATKIPMKRIGVPDDIAKVAVFLASSASDYMTGAMLVVDGGMLLA
jgi:2-deoxy-D-gluconate 3-dehydrogenase